MVVKKKPADATRSNLRLNNAPPLLHGASSSAAMTDERSTKVYGRSNCVRSMRRCAIRTWKRKKIKRTAKRTTRKTPRRRRETSPLLKDRLCLLPNVSKRTAGAQDSNIFARETEKKRNVSKRQIKFIPAASRCKNKRARFCWQLVPFVTDYKANRRRR